jgi:hypothetical protein
VSVSVIKHIIPGDDRAGAGQISSVKQKEPGRRYGRRDG